MRKNYIFTLALAIIVAAVGFSSMPLAAQAATDTTPPSRPLTPSASITATHQILVGWGASTDNIAVAGYRLYRNGELVANTPNTSFIDAAPSGQLYTYAVAAYDAAGNVSLQSPNSGPISLVKDTTPPTTPKNLVASASNSAATLSWSGATDDVGVTGYYLYRDNAQLIISTTTPFVALTYTDKNLTSGSAYSYTVAAYDASGNISARSSAVIVTTSNDVTPPLMPAITTTSAKSEKEIDLVWKPTTDNTGVVGYYVYRNGSKIDNVSSTRTEYASINLTADTIYTYSIAAYDAAGNISVLSNEVTATTLPHDTSPPSVPRFLDATAVSGSEIDLLWPTSTDDIGVVGYYVFKNGTQVGSVASTSYRVMNLATSTTYSFAVKAYDLAGNIAPVATVSITTLATNPAQISVPAVNPASTFSLGHATSTAQTKNKVATGNTVPVESKTVLTGGGTKHATSSPQTNNQKPQGFFARLWKAIISFFGVK